jgi:putative sigma-54 modulation protein
MSIQFSTKNVKFPGALKAYTEKHLEDIAKIAGHIIDGEVIVSEEKLSFKVVISLKTQLNSFSAESSDKILKQALSTALATIKAQSRKIKGKVKEEKKRGARGFLQRTARIFIPERPEPRPSRADDGDSITVSASYSRKPISVEEAIFFLRDSGENCYMFVNAESGRMAAVYVNQQGRVSLIEPEL